jgi:hypothetical protein
MPDLASKAAAARGFNLNELLDGNGFNLSDKMNLDALDRFLGNKAPKVKIGEFPNKKVEPNLPKPEQSVVPFEGDPVAPPGYTAAEWERIQGRKGFINDTVKNYDPAQELLNMGSEKLGQVGKSISGALNKVGIGSGLEAMPESVRNFVLNNRAEMEAGSSKLDSFFQQMAKTTSDLGITKSQLREMRDMYETGQEITDPKLKAVRDLLVKVTNEGVGGVEAGLKHETTHGIAPETLLDNYLHLSTERPSIASRILGRGLKGEDRGTITRGYAKERTYKTAAEAEADGHTVRNPISSTYDRLLESNKDVSNRKAVQRHP